MATFDLSTQTNLASRLVLTDNMVNTHSVLWVTLSCNEQIDWASTTVTYRGSDWEVVTFKEVKVSGAFKYSMVLYPKGVTKIVSRMCKDTRSLASFLGKTLADGSANIAFAPAYKGIMTSALMYKYRLQSLQDAASLKRSLFLFYNGRELMANTLSSLKTAKAVRLYNSQLRDVIINAQYSYTDSTNYNNYVSSHPPVEITYGSYYRTLFSQFATLETVFPLTAGYVYQLNSGETRLDSMGSLFLLKSIYDTKKSPVPYKHVFGRLADV